MTYAPAPGCGRGCLPKPGAVPTVGVLRRAGRLTALAGVLLAGIVVALLTPVLGTRGRARATQGWFRALLRAAGVRTVFKGQFTPANRGALVAPNHVSWLDIPVVLAWQPVRVVAKSDVRAWPVVGFMAAKVGTIFIDRRRVRTLPRTVSEIAAALRSGENVLAFPEGTTWCGRTQGRFYPATFQAAIDAEALVRPVALRYRLADGTVTTAAAFVGEDTLLESVLRVVATRGLTAELDPRPLADAHGAARRSMATATATMIAAPILADHELKVMIGAVSDP